MVFSQSIDDMGENPDILRNLSSLSLKDELNFRDDCSIISDSVRKIYISYPTVSEPDLDNLSPAFSSSCLMGHIAEDDDDVILTGYNIMVKNENKKNQRANSTLGNGEVAFRLTNPKIGGSKAILESNGVALGKIDDSQNDNEGTAVSNASSVQQKRAQKNGSINQQNFAYDSSSGISTAVGVTPSNRLNCYKRNFVISPELFNGWVRAFFNVAVTSVLLYIGMVFVMAISRDINKGLEKQRQRVKEEALSCQEKYAKNQCSTVQVPAMEEQCKIWETCMYKDAMLYDEASFLSAEVLGGVINTFVSQLDVRTVGIVLIAFLALFVGSNYAISLGTNRNSTAAGRPSEYTNWFAGMFSRTPPNGSQIYTPSPLMHIPAPPIVHNPYLVPNYCPMGNYPYVGNYQQYEQPQKTDSTTASPKPIKRIGGAWKRRFTPEWEDASYITR